MESTIIENQTIDGTLILNQWDNGIAGGISLLTDDSERVLLEHKFDLAKLEKHLNKQVRAKGDIISTPNNGKILYATKLKTFRANEGTPFEIVPLFRKSLSNQFRLIA